MNPLNPPNASAQADSTVSFRTQKVYSTLATNHPPLSPQNTYTVSYMYVFFCPKHGITSS